MKVYRVEGSLALLSMIASTLVVITYLFIRDLRKHPSNLVFYLVVSDFFFALRIVVLSGWFDSQALERTGWVCAVEAVWYQFFGIASICWNGAIALNLCIALRRPFTNTVKFARLYHVWVWGLAAVTSVLIVAFQLWGVSGDGSCWIKGSTNPWRVIFFAPLVLNWLLSIMSFAVVLLSYRALRLQADVARGSIVLRMLLFSAAFIVCWSGAVAHRVAQWFGSENEAFLYWDVVGVSLQGLANATIWMCNPSFFHGFRRLFLERLPFVRGRLEHLPILSQGDVQSIDSLLRRQTILFMLHGVCEAAEDSGRLAPAAGASPKPMDFTDYQEYTRLRSQDGREVSLFRFQDCAPMVFYRLRDLDGVRLESYLRSMNPGRFMTQLQSLRWSEGRSGSFFAFTPDRKYIIKTIPRGEFELLRRTLPQYYAYIYQNPRSLLTRYYGLHAISMVGGDRIYVVIMNNAFNTPSTIHERYDLKGSWVRREAGARHRANPREVLGMDVDWRKRGLKIAIEEPVYAALVDQVDRDAAFLCSLNIMDYSLLLGVHDLSYAKRDSMRTAYEVNIETGTWDSSAPPKSDSRSNHTSLTQSGSEHLMSFLPGAEDAGVVAVDGSRIFYMAIIDCLQRYNLNKKAERTLKRCIGKDSRGISVQPPEPYRVRFIAAFRNMFDPVPVPNDIPPPLRASGQLSSSELHHELGGVGHHFIPEHDDEERGGVGIPHNEEKPPPDSPFVSPSNTSQLSVEYDD